ncbi:MAG: AAA family ATPase, partial [Nocardioides sp.]|uniref:AAA family ATPase n=1 Tax=Nocardioides sp. TaxID=35761 RepID=UPI0039E2FADA
MSVGTRSPASAVVGRASERRRLARFVTSGSGALLLTGEAGIGKSTLLAEAAALAGAHGATVLTGFAAETDAERPFCVITDLFDGLDLAGFGLTDPVLAALEAATLRRGVTVPVDPTAVEVGTWQVLRALGDGEPVVVALDDVAWSDRASLRALGHAVRRLAPSSYRFVLSRRAGLERTELERELTKAGLELVECGPMGRDDLGRLVGDRLGLRLPAWVLDKLVDQAQGNPLFALEFGLVLRERGLPGYGEPLRLGDDLDATIGARVTALPARARAALLAVALEPRLTEPDLFGVAGEAAVREALDRDVLDRRPDGRLRPRHPLLASVVRRLATAAETRATHLRIAETSTEPETAARHLALGRPWPEEDTAARLDHAVRLGTARGATESATELAGLALARSPAGSPRGS